MPPPQASSRNTLSHRWSRSPDRRSREESRVAKPRIRITYCTQCNWLLRAQWYQGELLTTFAADVAEIALAPATGGVFRIDVDGEGVWNRKTDGGFPDITALKRAVRDIVAPGRSLGHADRVDPSVT
nr:SelT/SelW/SelH family protein [Microbacterium thalassium]